MSNFQLTKKMNYNDLKSEELFVEANAIRFYMRQSGWVNHNEVLGFRSSTTEDAVSADTVTEPISHQPHRQLNWIDWAKSL